MKDDKSPEMHLQVMHRALGEKFSAALQRHHTLMVKAGLFVEAFLEEHDKPIRSNLSLEILKTIDRASDNECPAITQRAIEEIIGLSPLKKQLKGLVQDGFLEVAGKQDIRLSREQKKYNHFRLTAKAQDFLRETLPEIDEAIGAHFAKSLTAEIAERHLDGMEEVGYAVQVPINILNLWENKF